MSIFMNILVSATIIVLLTPLFLMIIAEYEMKKDDQDRRDRK